MCDNGGNYLKYLKTGWKRTEGRGHKDFKKRGQAGSRGGCLKKGGGGTGTSLQTVTLSFWKGIVKDLFKQTIWFLTYQFFKHCIWTCEKLWINVIFVWIAAVFQFPLLLNFDFLCRYELSTILKFLSSSRT